MMARTDFVERSSLTREALAFADKRHAGQKREIDGEIPFVTHPIEAACLLHEGGYPDEVVAAGVLLEHYEASLEMLRRQLPGHPLVDQLATEFDALDALRGAV